MAGVRIGVDKLHYSICTDGDTETWAAPVALKGVINVNINPNTSQETLFADDGPYESSATLGQVEVEIGKAQLTLEERGILLGHTYANGVLTSKSSDVAPYVAIGFRTLKSNGDYRYVWLYKGRFQDLEDSNETKGDSVNFQTDTLNGQFLQTHKNGAWKVEVDGDSTEDVSTIIAGWFTKVYEPTVVGG